MRFINKWKELNSLIYLNLSFPIFILFYVDLWFFVLTPLCGILVSVLVWYKFKWLSCVTIKYKIIQTRWLELIHLTSDLKPSSVSRKIQIIYNHFQKFLIKEPKGTSFLSSSNNKKMHKWRHFSLHKFLLFISNKLEWKMLNIYHTHFIQHF